MCDVVRLRGGEPEYGFRDPPSLQPTHDRRGNALLMSEESRPRGWQGFRVRRYRLPSLQGVSEGTVEGFRERRRNGGGGVAGSCEWSQRTFFFKKSLILLYGWPMVSTPLIGC